MPPYPSISIYYSYKTNRNNKSTHSRTTTNAIYISQNKWSRCTTGVEDSGLLNLYSIFSFFFFCRLILLLFAEYCQCYISLRLVIPHHSAFALSCAMGRQTQACARIAQSYLFTIVQMLYTVFQPIKETKRYYFKRSRYFIVIRYALSVLLDGG